MNCYCSEKTLAFIKKHPSLIYLTAISFESSGLEEHEKGIYFLEQEFLEKLSSKEPEKLELFTPKSILVVGDLNEEFLKLICVFDFCSIEEEEYCLKKLENMYHFHLQQENTRKLKQELARTEEEIHELQQVGVALSTEKDIYKLLNKIIELCSHLTCSDAGVLYLVEKEEGEKRLRFAVNYNNSLSVNSVSFTMPFDKSSIAGYVASTAEILNIQDSYKIPDDVEYSHSKTFDEQYNYTTKSILAFPLLDHLDSVMGVIQLINKRTHSNVVLTESSDFKNNVISFSEKDETFVSALSSQAAVALENAMLYDSIQKLFEGFVTASVKAIESRDPTTSGHSERVAFYAVELAKAVSASQSERFSQVKFSDEEIKELRYAALLHDFGKVGVRESVLTKQKKLSPAQEKEVLGRFSLAFENLENQKLKLNLDYLKNAVQIDGREFIEIYKDFEEKVEHLKKLKEAFVQINTPSYLNPELKSLLEEIYQYEFIDANGNKEKLVSEEEYKKLCLVKGNLDENERLEIESHVTHSYEFLCNIPWTPEMQRIPDIAHSHHEKLDGTGYPLHLKERQIPLRGRIMAVVDIYDALTASDRPYKKAFSPEKALQIIQEESERGHLDKDLVQIFIEEKIFEKIFEVFSS